MVMYLFLLVCFILLTVKLLKLTDTYLPIRHHRQIGLETIRRSIYSIMRQSVLILLDWLLRSVPVAAGITEAVVGGVVLVLLRWGEGVEISLHVPLGLGVELRLKRGQLLGHAEEPSDFYTEDHPDYIWGEKKYTVVSLLCCWINLSFLWPLKDDY